MPIMNHNPNIKALALPWQDIDTVLLDMDGTLLDLYFDWHFWMQYIPQKYAEKNHISVAEADRFIHEKIHAQAGTLNWYCLDYWTQQLDLPIALLKHELKHLIKEHPEVLNFLARLKALGKKVVMVTNAHRDSLNLKLQMTEIGQYFDCLISTHDYGYPKEDRRIWHSIQSTFPYDRTRTLLIDDNIRALETAQAFGIEHLLAAIHVSPELPKVDPKGFAAFEDYREIMP